MRCNNKMIDYNNRFRFYITTVLPNPHYLPEIATKITLLNFAITETGLQQKLLATIISEERTDLQEKKEKLIIETAKNRDLLYKLESNILEVLAASEGNILEDENAINILSTSKSMSEEIQAKQLINASTESEIDVERQKYLPVAQYSSILYFCLMQLANVNSMYQYSLDWFVALFIANISATPNCTKLDERINKLQESFTIFIYKCVHPSLYEKDCMAFAMVICIEMMRSQVNLTNILALSFILNNLSLFSFAEKC